MKKRGFTLIELLAVIVVLAIIALIAVPIVINLINKTRQGSAKESARAYVKAVENYQIESLLNNNEILVTGKYNVSKETVIENKKYKSLNSIVELGGTKPSGGTVTISEKQKVSSAMLCENNYLIEYVNENLNIVSDDCGDLGNTIEYSTDTNDYAIKRILTITYPNSNYEFYYKVSGKATLSEKEIEKNKEMKTNLSTISIVLEENQNVEAWLVKSGKKVSIRTYIEDKIDNAEIVDLKISDETAIYPTLSNQEIINSTLIKLDYEKQEGSSAYYSLDDGTSWIKYEGATSTPQIINNIKAKIVRDKSKREGNVVEKNVEQATNTLGKDAYDGNASTYVNIGTSIKYMNIDSSMIGEKIGVSQVNTATTSVTMKALDKDDNVLETKKFSALSKFTSIMTVPENTVRISLTGSGNWPWIGEIGIYSFPTYKISEVVYPTISSTGVTEGYYKIAISYPKNVEKKLYSYDKKTWYEYDKSVNLKIKSTLYMKGVYSNNNETPIASYIYETSNDFISKDAYDGNASTYVNIGTSIKYMNIDSSMIGEKIGVSQVNTATTSVTMKALDKDDNVLETKKFSALSKFTSIMTVPENTVRISLTGSGNWPWIGEIGIYK